jgi:hypothetical protein
MLRNRSFVLVDLGPDTSARERRLAARCPHEAERGGRTFIVYSIVTQGDSVGAIWIAGADPLALSQPTGRPVVQKES